MSMDVKAAARRMSALVVVLALAVAATSMALPQAHAQTEGECDYNIAILGDCELSAFAETVPVTGIVRSGSTGLEGVHVLYADTTTGSDGSFAFDFPPGLDIDLVVSAPEVSDRPEFTGSVINFGPTGPTFIEIQLPEIEQITVIVEGPPDAGRYVVTIDATLESPSLENANWASARVTENGMAELPVFAGEFDITVFRLDDQTVKWSVPYLGANPTIVSMQMTPIEWYPDADGDGFGDETAVPVVASERPGPEYKVDNTDCDDTRSDVYPGASEVPGNDVDEDCDGSDAEVLPAGPTCFGHAVTINMRAGDAGVGTAGDDVILGTYYDDVIIGLGGNDVICAGGGADIVNAGPGDDVVNGGGGEDDIRGGTGDDDLRGGTGNDLVRGDNGDDLLRGGTGDDDLRGNRDDDRVWGELGDDVLRGGPGDDDLRGGPGGDQLKGGTGNDQLRGFGGDDRLLGFDGDDNLLGGDDFDSCWDSVGTNSIIECERSSQVLQFSL